MKGLAKRLTIRNLRLIDAIVSEGNLVRAAARLNMSQSAVTKALQEVEAIAGVKLFVRTNRGVAQTPFGEALAAHARIIMVQLGHAEQELEDLRDGMGGRITVGTLLSAAVDLLPTAIARIREQRPRLAIKIVEGTNDVLMPALRRGELDLVLGRLSEYRERADLIQETLMQDFAQVVSRAGHSLAKRRAVQLSDLVNQNWVLPRQETTLRRQIEAAFRNEGLEPPQYVVESVSLLTNRALIVNADYLAVWPFQLAQLETEAGTIAVLPIELPTTLRPIGITMRAGVRLSPAADAFAETLRGVAFAISKRKRK